MSDQLPATPPIPKPLTELPALNTTVFIFEKRPSGTWKHTAGEVVDLNTHVKAVKLRYCPGIGKILNKWFPLTMLTATRPMKEAKQ